MRPSRFMFLGIGHIQNHNSAAGESGGAATAHILFVLDVDVNQTYYRHIPPQPGRKKGHSAGKESPAGARFVSWIVCFSSCLTLLRPRVKLARQIGSRDSNIERLAWQIHPFGLQQDRQTGQVQRRLQFRQDIVPQPTAPHLDRSGYVC